MPRDDGFTRAIIPHHDASCEADDWWRELTDPASEFGLSCTAYFTTR